MHRAQMTLPILYSFRRCPYAIRARLALQISAISTDLREIVLRDKAPAFLSISPSQSVPCLQHENFVIDESLDIMIWALRQNDPQGWLKMPDAGYALIEQNDGAFKAALDRTKYPNRFPQDDPLKNRQIASEFLQLLNEQLQTGFLFGPTATLADSAILPFVRQFAFINKPWFDAQPWPYVQRWLEGFLGSDAFHLVMQKYPKWQYGDPPTLFPSLQKHHV